MALAICGSHSARTFRPSSWPNCEVKSSLLMLCLIQSLTPAMSGVGVVDLIGLQEVLELLHHGVVDCEVFGDGVGGEVVLAEVEEGVVDEQDVLEVVGLQVVDLLVGGDAAAAVDGAAGVGEFDLEVGLVLGLVASSRT